MFEDSFGFSDSIEIVPSVDETQEVKNEVKNPQVNVNDGPIIVDEVKDEPRKKDEKRDNSKNVPQRTNTNRNYRNDEKPSLRQQSLYSITANMYVEKFTEYADIPDFIVNQIFDINDGKGTITIEEAIIMLINLFPNTRDSINSARLIEDAIKIGKKEIIENLYKECKTGFSLIPVHSRENLSKKITSDVENENFEAALYDYQIMRISGYIR